MSTYMQIFLYQKKPLSYRVKIQTVNTYGRSLWSQPFEFDTYGGDPNNHQNLYAALEQLFIILYFSYVCISVQTQKPSPFFFASTATSTILPLPLHLLLLPQVLLLPLLQDRLPQTPAFLWLSLKARLKMWLLKVSTDCFPTVCWVALDIKHELLAFNMSCVALLSLGGILDLVQ